MENIVHQYRLYHNTIPSRIKKSSIKTSVILKKIGMPKATFYKKMKQNSFDINEVEMITKILAVEAYIDAQIKSGEEDIAAGRTLSAKEAIEKLKDS